MRPIRMKFLSSVLFSALLIANSAEATPFCTTQVLKSAFSPGPIYVIGEKKILTWAEQHQLSRSIFETYFAELRKLPKSEEITAPLLKLLEKVPEKSRPDVLVMLKKDPALLTERIFYDTEAKVFVRAKDYGHSWQQELYAYSMKEKLGVDVVVAKKSPGTGATFDRTQITDKGKAQLKSAPVINAAEAPAHSNKVGLTELHETDHAFLNHRREQGIASPLDGTRFSKEPAKHLKRSNTNEYFAELSDEEVLTWSRDLARKKWKDESLSFAQVNAEYRANPSGRLSVDRFLDLKGSHTTAEGLADISRQVSADTQFIIDQIKSTMDAKQFSSKVQLTQDGKLLFTSDQAKNGVFTKEFPLVTETQKRRIQILKTDPKNGRVLNELLQEVLTEQQRLLSLSQAVGKSAEATATKIQALTALPKEARKLNFQEFTDLKRSIDEPAQMISKTFSRAGKSQPLNAGTATIDSRPGRAIMKRTETSHASERELAAQRAPVVSVPDQAIVLEKAAVKSLEGFRTSNVSVYNDYLRWEARLKKVGLAEFKKLPGVHDEPLIGYEKGIRSMRINQGYRVMYRMENNEMIVIGVGQDLYPH